MATLVQKQVQLYHDAGHREEFRVAYNPGTCPGERNTVVLEWETAEFQSPSREGNVRPSDGVEAGNAFKPYIEDTYIESWELLTPSKMQE